MNPDNGIIILEVLVVVWILLAFTLFMLLLRLPATAWKEILKSTYTGSVAGCTAIVTVLALNLMLLACIIVLIAATGGSLLDWLAEWSARMR